MAEAAKDYLHDPYILDFLNLQNQTYQESQLEQAIISNLQQFLLELGKGFAFVGMPPIGLHLNTGFNQILNL
ncbi:PDDEXK nuclease domain-containing protein [Vreelandella arcis]|uniref:YhcG PDDEXK nuclease domain-containing protein n=1 Tax=Vreelandella arcis TaxID=416873 RepID=A0A1G9X2R2_9GAMM|nr:PDDEXK nuclease domain-containing protein [Halomonas arcis]SDM90673.1 Protein of unknown function [Halomonas arcis]